MLDQEATLIQEVKNEIERRWNLRDSQRVFSDSESRKIVSVVTEVLSGEHPHSSVMAFLDHALPSGASFCPVRNLYMSWKTFQSETLPTIKHLFPVTDEDDRKISRIIEDWKALSKSPMFYRRIYISPNRVGGAKWGRLYRHSPDFYRMLEVLKHYRSNSESYPLFTFRSFLACQVEILTGYVDRFVVGNVVSEKARERYEDWYCARYYPDELLKKARERPSDNNPVNNSKARLEYEKKRIRARAGEFVFEGEEPLFEINSPALYCNEGEEHKEDASSGIVLPSKLDGLLRE